MIGKNNLTKITNYLWEIRQEFRSDMRVPARIFASEEMLSDILEDRSLEQLVNVTTLPGIQQYALAMPDIHEGYGFPIGGVAATEYPDGTISPGGIGYDINCGVRLLTSALSFTDIQSHCGMLSKKLFHAIPSGVGRGGSAKLSIEELDTVLQNGMIWAFEKEFAQEEDLTHTESQGRLPDAIPEAVSSHAKARGHDQLGTIGAGNHFVEVDIVNEIFQEEIASTFGLYKDQVVVLVHTGSRGLGHQVATDYIRQMLLSLDTHNIQLPDRELACAPLSSPEGINYFHAMAAAANFAWVNRQLITWELRTVWKEVFPSAGKLQLLYDVAHNIAKIEEHDIHAQKKKVIMHRKGATRAFPPGNSEIPNEFRETGQPVLIPGSMGTASYVLVGTREGMKNSFGSTCHGAGRSMSRHKAVEKIRGKELLRQLHEKQIYVACGSIHDLPEEAPFAYKDIDSVINVVDKANVAKKVARLIPKIVIKG